MKLLLLFITLFLTLPLFDFLQNSPHEPLLKLKSEFAEPYGFSIQRISENEIAVCNSSEVYFVRDGKIRQTSRISGFWQGETAISADGQSLLVGTFQIDLTTGEANILPDLTNQFSHGLTESVGYGFYEVPTASWSPDGRDLVAFLHYRPSRRYGDKTIYQGPDTRLLVIDRANHKTRLILRNDAGFGDRQPVAVSARHIASADQTIRIWDRESGKLLHEINSAPSFCSQLRFDHAGKYLAAGRVDGTIEIFSVESGKREFVDQDLFTQRVRGLAFQSEKEVLFAGGDDDKLAAIFWKKSAAQTQIWPVGDHIEGISVSNVDPNLGWVSTKFRSEKILVYEINP
ncbi:MAG: hypothetical protein H6581_00960 [Bacteroidia bacterium]|nr:hypothetical protein [Bacteroidia bacterium]